VRADEAEQVLRHLEDVMDRESSGDWFRSMWHSDSTAAEILTGLEERVATGEKVARFYENHDKSQLAYLEE